MHPPLLDDVPPPLDAGPDLTKAIAEVDAHLTRADTNKAPLGFGAASFGGHGFAAYARAGSREELLRMLAAEQAEPYHRLVWSARLALGKYQLIRNAGILTAAAVVAAAVVGAAALATHLA